MSLLGVICHDAGAANLIKSYLENTHLPFLIYTEGPATKIFEDSAPQQQKVSLPNLFKWSDKILLGTSHFSSLEYNSILEAKKLGISTISYLDHWNNYLHRFTRNNQLVLPDEIWVPDSISYDLAKRELKPRFLRIEPNPYLTSIKAEVLELSTRLCSNPNHILYLSEPISTYACREYGDPNYWGFTEHDALQYLLARLHLLNIPDPRIFIKLHPGDPSNLYSTALDRHPNLLTLLQNVSLAQSLATTSTVVGCSTMAMVAALTCGKRVLSLIPPHGRTTPLPHKDIINIFDL